MRTYQLMIFVIAAMSIAHNISNNADKQMQQDLQKIDRHSYTM